MMANSVTESPEGKPRNERACEIIAEFDRARASAAATFGPVSKAAYIVTWAALTEMFRLYVSVDSMSHREDVRTSLEHLRRHSHDLFEKMTMAPRPERKISITPAGREYHSYVFTGEDEDIRAGRALLRDHVVEFATLAEERQEGTYLYVASETNGIRAYRNRLSFKELMHGARFESMIVKHPMLVGERESVMCAGEMHVSFSETREPAVFVTRASGHYQPLASAERALVKFLRETCDMKPWAVQSLSQAIT